MLWKSLGSIGLHCKLFVNRIVLEVVDKVVWIEFEIDLDLV